MKARRLTVLVLALSALLPAVALAAPTTDAARAKMSASGPCAPGAIYEPACDVDHDGDVDIFDIQLTAGRWNQTGTWISDNDHNHLGPDLDG